MTDDQNPWQQKTITDPEYRRIKRMLWWAKWKPVFVAMFLVSVVILTSFIMGCAAKIERPIQLQFQGESFNCEITQEQWARIYQGKASLEISGQSCIMWSLERKRK